MAANYTALGILGLAAAGLLVYEVMRPKTPPYGGMDPIFGGATPDRAQPGGASPGTRPAEGGIDTDAAALEDIVRTQRGELRPLPANVDATVVAGRTGADGSGPITAIGALALHAGAQGTPVTFDVWLDFGDSRGPVQTVTVQPGTTQRLDLYARHEPFVGSLYTRLLVRTTDTGGSVDRGTLPPYLSVAQGGATREFGDV